MRLPCTPYRVTQYHIARTTTKCHVTLYAIQPVILWTDALVWLLVAAVSVRRHVAATSTCSRRGGA